MPIEQLLDDHLVQRCAGCATTRTIPHASLVAGVGGSSGMPFDPAVIEMPACAACKAQEFFVRSGAEVPSVPAPGYGHLHRLLVDRLHDMLVAQKRVVPDAPTTAIRVGPPVDDATMKRWFPNGLVLPPPVPSTAVGVSTTARVGEATAAPDRAAVL
jgi:hypothetical protein